MLLVCGVCTARFSVGAPRCPQCGSTSAEDLMPKNSVIGGPSNEATGLEQHDPDNRHVAADGLQTHLGSLEPDAPAEVPPGKAGGVRASAVAGEGKVSKVKAGGAGGSKGGASSRAQTPAAGTDSSPSTAKPRTSRSAARKSSDTPARTTGNRSAKARTGSGSAGSTGTARTPAPARKP